MIFYNSLTVALLSVDEFLVLLREHFLWFWLSLCLAFLLRGCTYGGALANLQVKLLFTHLLSYAATFMLIWYPFCDLKWMLWLKAELWLNFSQFTVFFFFFFCSPYCICFYMLQFSVVWWKPTYSEIYSEYWAIWLYSSVFIQYWVCLHIVVYWYVWVTIG